MTKALARLCVLLLLFAAGGGVQAAELTIGRSGEPSSIDPLFSRTGVAQMTAQHMFDRLVDTDENLQIHPALATAWRTIDPLTWEITLREGVRFHDGQPFTAADVIFSLERARNVPNSPAPFSGAVTAVASVEARGEHTVIIRTRQPTPLLMEQVGLVFICSAKAAAGATSQDFNTGRAAVGTGPYRFASWRPGEALVMEANADYWNGRPAFDRVSLRPIPAGPARVAALLSGQVDVIDEVPITDIELLRGRGFAVTSVETARIVYLALDSAREQTPFAVDAQNRPLSPNPLRDVRVRRAISLMIDRGAIVQRLLSGAGEPSVQMVPQGLGGFDPELSVPARADPAAARRLLAEAGYPQGFGLTIHTSADRFPGDRDLGQVIAQFLTRGGLRVPTVEAKTYAVYSTEATRQAYSAFVFSFGSSSSNAIGAFTNVLATYDEARGTGAFNRSRWSNAGFDAALAEASAAFDEGERDRALRRGARILADEVGLVPLYFQRLYWAARPGLRIEGGKDEATLAMRVTAAR